MNEISAPVKEDVDQLKWRVFYLEFKNTELTPRIVSLEKQRKNERLNIESAKARAVENDQYACRCNVIVYGLQEQRNDNPGQTIISVIRDHLQISLRPDSTEVCHRLGQRTRQTQTYCG